jgi:nucleoside-diphosphate kinase
MLRFFVLFFDLPKRIGQFFVIMEMSLIILKPDCMQKKLAGAVISRLEQAGLDLVAAKMATLDSRILREHYAHVADKPFFPEIEAFMMESPVLLMIWQGQGCISKIRELLGPTDSSKAPKGTIRGDMGEDMMRNLVHASDGQDTAKTELRRFFPECAA